jgi:hypothetical protein
MAVSAFNMPYMALMPRPTDHFLLSIEAMIHFTNSISLGRHAFVKNDSSGL